MLQNIPVLHYHFPAPWEPKEMYVLKCLKCYVAFRVLSHSAYVWGNIVFCS